MPSYIGSDSDVVHIEKYMSDICGYLQLFLLWLVIKFLYGTKFIIIKHFRCKIRVILFMGSPQNALLCYQSILLILKAFVFVYLTIKLASKG